MSPKSPPFNFLIFCKRTNVKKSQRVPFFRILGTMRLSGNFKKIRKFFSQILVLKDRFFKDRSFFYATFLKFVFTEAPAQFLQETKRFARGLLKALRLTGDHQKCFREILNFFPSIFCLRFSNEKECFWRCKIDEILTMSFYTWFSV